MSSILLEDGGFLLTEEGNRVSTEAVVSSVGGGGVIRDFSPYNDLFNQLRNRNARTVVVEGNGPISFGSSTRVVIDKTIQREADGGGSGVVGFFGSAGIVRTVAIHSGVYSTLDTTASLSFGMYASSPTVFEVDDSENIMAILSVL